MSGIARQIYKSLLPYESRMWLYKLRHPGHYRRMRTIVNPSEKGDFSLAPFDRHHCIFIHITKTAGTSVAKSLFGYLPYHHTAIDYRVIYGKKLFNAYFKFAFVRNPWDRLYSAYRYLAAGGWNDEDRIWYQENLSPHGDFLDFVKNWLTRDNIRKHRHFWPQHFFICDNRNRLLLDHLAYYETLHEDFGVICRQLNINTSLGRHNVNPGHDYKKMYDEEARAIVGQVYSCDIELFGYDFNGILERTSVRNRAAYDHG